MTVSFDDLIAGNSDDNTEAAKAMAADKAIKPGSINSGTTGVPSAFRANVVKAYAKPRPNKTPAIAPKTPRMKPWNKNTRKNPYR